MGHLDDKQLVQGWTKNWWSPKHPSAYGFPLSAPLDVAAFNLAWGACSDKQQPNGLLTPLMHMSYRHMQVLLKPAVVDGYPLAEWICLYGPVDFDQFLVKSNASKTLRQFVRPATLKAIGYYLTEHLRREPL